MKPKISVLISTYKEPIEWFEKSLNSIINQTYKNIEIIVIVDEPNNTEIINLLNRYLLIYKNIRFFINESNIGLVKSLNKGLQYCSGEYIARMDADDISEINRFEEQIKFLLENNYDLVGCEYQIFYDNNILGVHKVPYTHNACKKVLRYMNCIAHSSWLVKKSVFDKLGGYREIYTCEDYDFLLKTVMSGFKIGNTPKVLLKYRRNLNGITHSNRYMQIIITDYIAKLYRKNKIITLPELEKFLKSNVFNKRLSEESKLYKIESKYKNKNNNSVYRCICLFRLIVNSTYIKRKFSNKYVQLVKMFDVKKFRKENSV